MKKRFLAALATGLLVVGMGGVAQATITTGDYLLTQSNELGYFNYWATVSGSYDDVSGLLSFVVTANNAVFDPDSTSDKGLAWDKFFFNYSSNVESDEFIDEIGIADITITGASSFAVDLTDPHASSFGVFDVEVSNTKDFLNPLYLTISLSELSYYGDLSFNDFAVVNSDGYRFAGHLRNFDELINKDGTIVNVGMNSAFFGGGTPVPEPATMLLFGTGLAGLAGIARRRKKN